MKRNLFTKSRMSLVTLIGSVTVAVTLSSFAQNPGAPPTGPGAGAAAAGGAGTAAGGSPGGEAQAERVVVIGSNIPTAEEVGPNPVLNLNRDFINKTGEQTAEQLLRDQPIMNSNTVPTGNNGTGQGGPPGSSGVSLRGFDLSATLVLVDGMRVVPYLGGTFVDLNTIPLPAIESIEILKEGASAIYGADAIAGVINIKLWKDYRGAQYDVYYGNTLDKDAAIYKGDVLFGAGDDKISVNGDIFYYHHNSTFNIDRGNSLSPPFLSSNSSPWNLNVSKAVAAAAGGTAVAGTNPLEFASAPDFTNGLAPASSYLYSGGRVRTVGGIRPGFNFNLFSSSFPEQERWGGYAAFNDKVCGEQVQLYGDFYYVDSKTHDELAPIATGSFLTTGQPTLAIPPHSNLMGVAPPNTPRFAGQPASAVPGEIQTNVPIDAFNPFNPFNQIISGGSRARIFDFGNRFIDTENEAWLTTLGVKGDKLFDGNWGYDGAFRYSQIYTIAQIQTASASRLARIMNANDSIFDPNSASFIGTTVPYNPFTDYRSPTFASNIPSINYARANIRDLTLSKEAEFELRAYTTDLFDLPAGGVGLAFGGEFRRQNYDFNPDDENKTGDQIGVGFGHPSFGGRKAYGIYGETNIPIFSPAMGIPGFHSLELTGAVRFEEFLNNSSNVVVPRWGVRWQPFDEQLTLRSTFGYGFLEPTLGELFGAPAFLLVTTTHNGVTEPETSFEITSNKHLQPEDSRNFTAGLVYTPKWMPSGQTLTFSADFWDIERTGVVVVPSAQEVVNRALSDTGTSLTTQPGEIVQYDPTTGSVNFVKTNFFNNGRQKGRGVDLSLQYQLQTQFGLFTWLTRASYLDSFLFQLDSSQTTHEVSGRANNDPFEGAFFGQVTIGDGWLKWKGDSSLDWSWHNLDLFVIERYFDGFKEEFQSPATVALNEGTDIVTDPTIPPHEHYVKQRWFTDGQLSYDLIFTPPVEEKAVAGYSKGGKEVLTGKDGKAIESTAAYSMPCWKNILNNTKLIVGCNNIFGEDPPKSFGFGSGNSNNYPGGLYDNLGRFYYVEMRKKF
ncbi:MAG: iron complex outerrane recepter protein [Verrucomicrobiota bacterium]